MDGPGDQKHNGKDKAVAPDDKFPSFFRLLNLYLFQKGDKEKKSASEDQSGDGIRSSRPGFKLSLRWVKLLLFSILILHPAKALVRPHPSLFSVYLGLTRNTSYTA